MRRRGLFFLLLLLPGIYAAGQTVLPYKNSKLPVAERVKDLLGRMTPEEKFWQLFMIPGDLGNASPSQYRHGLFGFQVSASGKGDTGGQLLQYNASENVPLFAGKINAIQRYFVENTRLGIPIVPFDEALHGLVRDGATVFPQAIGLAASWDTALMSRVANAIAGETKQRGIRQVLSPVVNIAADPRWGRTEETYGEDPFLAAEMGVHFVRAFEKKGIITTPKHFVANVGDGGRDSYPIHYNERMLEEIYFPPFRACIEKGGSRSIMTAYNSLDGTASSSNNWLLQEKLKKQWGFSGFVISDANAVGGELVLHNTAKDYAASGRHAINGGLDVIFQTEYKHHTLFIDPFLDGSIDSNRLNDAVSRVLQAKFEGGLFEDPYVPEIMNTSDEISKTIAKQAALESVVLLKNERNLLPLSRNTKSIAVIGTDAEEARMGGYSGPGTNKISILQGLQQKAGAKTRIIYTPGCGRETKEYTIIPASQLSSNGASGLQAAYFNNVKLEGEPLIRRSDKTIDFHWTLYGPGPGLDNSFYSARWTGKLLSPATGTFNIGLEGNDGYRLYINNRLLINNWQKRTYQTTLIPFRFEKGKQYDLRVEFYEPTGNATIKLIWEIGVSNNWKKKITDAVIAAKQSDVAIITAGIEEGEFRDRALLSLPGHQEELIRAVAATGKPVVVILIGGSAVTMNNWIENVPAILHAWYPGEQGGAALADILFGDYNPAGRLPITFPLHEGQLPLVYNHKPTGRGDDYNNLSGLPLFPFGYGLSYTKFDYSEIRLNKPVIGKNESATVSFLLKNTGTRDGEEVVQLFVRDILASVARPVMELKGFQRVQLKAGETKTISFQITPEMLSMLDENLQRVVEPGDFSIMLGASSADIRVKVLVTVKN